MSDTKLVQLVYYLDSLTDTDWQKLPVPLKDWCNKAAKALKAKKPLPDLPGPRYRVPNWMQEPIVYTPQELTLADLEWAWEEWLGHDGERQDHTTA